MTLPSERNAATTQSLDHGSFRRLASEVAARFADDYRQTAAGAVSGSVLTVRHRKACIKHQDVLGSHKRFQKTLCIQSTF